MTDVANAVPKPRNPGWIWFFVFVIVASVGVAVFMIAFNLSIQLKPQQLEDAWQLWKQNGPKSYDMVYTKRLNNDARVFTYRVKVRKEQVIEVIQDGKTLEKPKDRDDLYAYHSMDALFRDLDRNMTIDQAKGAPKVYVTAHFDDKHGGLRRYVRRVMGATQRIELHVTLEAVTDEPRTK